MRVLVQALVSLSLLQCAAALAGGPKTAKPKDGDSVKFEALGTIEKSSLIVPADGNVFVPVPKPCASGFLLEKEVGSLQVPPGERRTSAEAFQATFTGGEDDVLASRFWCGGVGTGRR